MRHARVEVNPSFGRVGFHTTTMYAYFVMNRRIHHDFAATEVKGAIRISATVSNFLEEPTAMGFGCKRILYEEKSKRS